MRSTRRGLILGAAAGTAAVAPAPGLPAQALAPAVPSPRVPLSSFAGATDDDRLSAFMAWGAAQTHRGTTVELDEVRDYVFTRRQVLYDGFSLLGSPRPQDQARDSVPVGQRVVLRTDGGWFSLGRAQTHGCSLQGLSIDGSAGSRLVDGHRAYVLWTSVFRDISAQNCGGVLGSAGQPLLNTACTVDGWWNVNNVRERAFNLAGSDTFFKPSEMLLDSPPDLLPDSGFLLSLSHQSKGEVSGIYCTAEGHSGVLLGGGTGVTFRGNVLEGRNADQPCHGALLRIEGGTWMVRDNVLNFAMADPARTGRDDRGVVHVAGGNVLIDGVVHEPARGVSAETPLVYAAGGRVRVRNVLADRVPVVRQAAPGLIDADDTVRLVTHPG